MSIGARKFREAKNVHAGTDLFSETLSAIKTISPALTRKKTELSP